MKTDRLNNQIIQKIQPVFITLAIFIFLILFPVSAYSQTWSALAGGGMNDWVYATAIFNGDLIVGGKFTSAGGVSANHIARWDGLSWSPLDLGVNGKVNSLIVYEGNLVAAGEFTSAGGIEVNFIAQWDGLSWNDELGGVGSTVTSLAILNNELYAGGYFIEADNTPVNYIAKRDTAGWVSLGSGMGGTEGQVMALTVHNGELYAGGFFTTAGGISANHIAKWNGTSWSALGSGISNIVYAISAYNGDLIAGGLFLSAGGNPANNIASWNGSSWMPLGGGMGGVFYQYVFALAVYNGNLIAGGYFTTSDGLATNGIAQWDGTAWSGMGGGLFYPGNVFGAHTFCVYGTDLIVGGLFSSAGSASASHIASWNEPLVPVVLNLQNDTVAMGSAPCYNAIQTVTVAGNGTSFVIQDGGSVTMFAGQNILFFPGTKVDSGGYLYGYAAPGLNCGKSQHAASRLLAGNPENASILGKPFFKVYPNPSDGIFFLELMKGQESSMINIEVFTMQGERVLSCFLSDKKEYQFSLSGHPAGVYFVRLISGTKTEILKIIKQQ